MEKIITEILSQKVPLSLNSAILEFPINFTNYNFFFKKITIEAIQSLNHTTNALDY